MMTSVSKAPLLASAVFLAGCAGGIDLDFRDLFSSDADTTQASQAPAPARPTPDARGVITYDSYQVAVARRADTVATVAQRVGIDAEELARFNGIRINDPLRDGEILALPSAVPPVGPGGPAEVDVTTLAGNAIDAAEAAQGANVGNLPDTGVEPIRHKVARGETAFTIARLYGVSPRDLARWNGLGSDLEVREGQFLLIPVQPPEASEVVSQPGDGSETPTPPSASQPLPADAASSAAPSAVPRPPTPSTPQTNIGPATSASASAAKFLFPVQGNIIRAYKKDVNDGIDIQGTPGADVKAADSGTVAAITKNTDQVPIVILRHADGILTVYANVDDVKVAKGDSVARGEAIGTVRKTDPTFLHFEVRRGLESTDPIPFLE